MTSNDPQRSLVGRALMFALALLPLGACQGLRPADGPMRSVFDESPETDGDKVLLVFLPGRGDPVERALQQGIAKMVRDRDIAADLVFADCHLGYYANRSMPDRLWHDVLEPATKRGYSAIWLAGISLGGFGSLLYATQTEGTERDCVGGILAIAPYLGSEDATAEVRAAGGLDRWQPAAALEPDDYSRRLWTYLRGYVEPEPDRPLLFLGVGNEDRFADAIALASESLPDEHSIVIPGRHTWQPWLEIWGTMLDRAPLPRVVVAD